MIHETCVHANFINSLGPKIHWHNLAFLYIVLKVHRRLHIIFNNFYLVAIIQY